jgi:hypothetical protein
MPFAPQEREIPPQLIEIVRVRVVTEMTMFESMQHEDRAGPTKEGAPERGDRAVRETAQEDLFQWSKSCEKSG